MIEMFVFITIAGLVGAVLHYMHPIELDGENVYERNHIPRRTRHHA
jgi:hypothetical protein